MAENKMKEVAKILGVELNERFGIEDLSKCCPDSYILNEGGLYNFITNMYNNSILVELLNGNLTIMKQPILNDKEKRYLENVLRPFKHNISYVEKSEDFYFEEHEYIHAVIDDSDGLVLPNFKSGKFYKGMELDKKYTIKELELFESDENKEESNK